MKLIKDLEKLSKKREKQTDSESQKLLDQVDSLLLNSAKESDEVLEGLGLDHQIKYTKRLEQQVHRNNYSKKIYEKEIHPGSDIADLCFKYDLRLLPTSYYNGSIPPELTRKISEFCTKHDMVDKDGKPIIKQNAFYILAPLEMFRTIKNVPIDMDPILFFKEGAQHGSSYQTAERSDNFINVHYWGKDFSFLREFRVFLNPYVKSTDDVSNSNFSCIMGIVFLIVLAMNFLGTLGFKGIGLIAYVLLFGIYSALIYSNRDEVKELWNKNIT